MWILENTEITKANPNVWWLVFVLKKRAGSLADIGQRSWNLKMKSVTVSLLPEANGGV